MRLFFGAACGFAHRYKPAGDARRCCPVRCRSSICVRTACYKAPGQGRTLRAASMPPACCLVFASGIKDRSVLPARFVWRLCAVRRWLLYPCCVTGSFTAICGYLLRRRRVSALVLEGSRTRPFVSSQLRGRSNLRVGRQFNILTGNRCQIEHLYPLDLLGARLAAPCCPRDGPRNRPWALP